MFVSCIILKVVSVASAGRRHVLWAKAAQLISTHLGNEHKYFGGPVFFLYIVPVMCQGLTSTAFGQSG